MDELTLTRELARETPLPTADRLAPARAQLMAATRAGARRGWLLGGTAGLVAAGIATALALDAQPVAAPAPIPTATTAPTQRTDLVSVAQFFDLAAAAAGAEPDVVPRPDQFIYVHDLKYGQDLWLSIDGRHDGRSIRDGRTDALPGCRDGRLNEDGTPCTVTPHYLPDLPTDPAALVTWLAAHNVGDDGKPDTNGIGKNMWELAATYWLRPAQRAAVYRAVGRTKGITLVPNVKDDVGHVGTGVAWASPGDTQPQVIWIFDPKTHRLLGGPVMTTTPPKLVNRVGDRQ